MNNIPIKDLCQYSEQLSREAHDSISQKRKYTLEPYWYHPYRVVDILREFTEDPVVLSAAYLHDVLEDVFPVNPKYSEEFFRAELGDHVTDMIMALSDPIEPGVNRDTRKLHARQRLEVASNDVKMIKLADCTDNFSDISVYDEKFALQFTKEIELMLPILRGGSEILADRLQAMVSAFKIDYYLKKLERG